MTVADMEKIAAHPLAGNAALGSIFSAAMFGSDLSIVNCFDELMERSREIKRGDLGSVEEMLIGQAASLNAMFLHYAQRSAISEGGLRVQETLIRVALKAQSQCRATLQTLAEIKNPRPVAFVKQANIANGPQQVNNAQDASSPTRARAGKTESTKSELLDVNDGERLDTGAPGAAINADPAMATLDEIDRAAHA